VWDRPASVHYRACCASLLLRASPVYMYTQRYSSHSASSRTSAACNRGPPPHVRSFVPSPPNRPATPPTFRYPLRALRAGSPCPTGASLTAASATIRPPPLNSVLTRVLPESSSIRRVQLARESRPLAPPRASHGQQSRSPTISDAHGPTSAVLVPGQPHPTISRLVMSQRGYHHVVQPCQITGLISIAYKLTEQNRYTTLAKSVNGARKSLSAQHAWAACEDGWMAGWVDSTWAIACAQKSPSLQAFPHPFLAPRTVDVRVVHRLLHVDSGLRYVYVRFTRTHSSVVTIGNRVNTMCHGLEYFIRAKSQSKLLTCKTGSVISSHILATRPALVLF
jgi:hypothetical protein